MAHQPTPGASGLPNGGYPPPNPNAWSYAPYVPTTMSTNGASAGGHARAQSGTQQQHQQQKQQHQQQLPPHIPPSYADPSSLLSVYPIGMYAPTARTAGHFAPHTETLQSSASTSDLYPQYAGAFQAWNAPQTMEDMQQRAEIAVRLARSLNSSGFSSYGNLPYSQPSEAQRSATTATSPSSSSPSFLDPSQHPAHHPQSSSSSSSQRQGYYQQHNFSATPQALPPLSFGQQSPSPHLAHQQVQQSPSVRQYQQASAHLQYSQSPTAQQLPQIRQQQYRQPTQSQSPQVQYRQPPQQSLSPVVGYSSPQLQNRLPSPFPPQPQVHPQTQYKQSSPYQTTSLDLSHQAQPSPVQQYQQPQSSSAAYPPSPVSSSAQYYTAQAQQATPSSAQYTQYLSPVSQQPQQQPPQHHQPQPQTQTQFQPNPTQQAGQAAYTSPPQANLNSPFSRQQYAQYTQQQTPTQNFQQQSQYSQPQQTNAYSHLQYSQAQHPQVQKLKSPPLQSSQLQSPVQSHKAVGQSQQPVVQAHLPVVQHQQPVVQSQPLPAQPQQLSQPRQAQPQVQQAQQQVQQQVQQQTSQPYQPLQPLPYALLPQNPLSNVAQPPTPISLTGSPAPSITNDYFESYINRTLKIQSPCPTPNGSQSAPDTQGVSVVPPATNAPIPSKPTLTIAPSSLAVPSRYKEQPNMERLSPDPIAMDVNGPSPAKKRKSNSSSRQSPPATPQKQKSSSFVIELKTLTPEERKKYKSLPTLSDFDRSTTSMRSTPATRDDESDDDLDWNDSTRVDGNGDWDMSAKFLGVDQSDAVFVTPTSGRTGDKDDRTSFQKLQSLMEDIFEESDTFSADLSIDEVSSSKYFAGLSVDGTQPNLSSYTIDKLIRYFTRLEDNKKRQRSKANAEAIPWDVNGLLRLFRMLDKTMRDAEEVDPFPSSGRKAVVAGNPSPKKKKGGKKAKDGQDLEASPSLDMTEEELEKGSLTLRIMKTAAASAVCCLTILDSKTMPKQLYSEDLLLSAVKTVRDQMTKVIFPVVEGLAGEKLSSNFLAHVVSDEASAAVRAKSSRKVTLFDDDNLASIAQSTCGAVPHIAKLIARSNMSFSDSLVIQTVYLGIGPLFVKEPTRRGRKSESSGGPTWSVMKSLRADALGCLRGAFAKYEDQRVWILDEILNSLGRNQDPGSGQAQASFQLPDGRSISTLTALLLQLIQSSSHGVGTRIRRLRSSRMDLDGADPNAPDEQELLAAEETRIMKEADQSALRSTTLIVMFLVQKASGNKTTKAAQDNDFKAILDTVVSDILQVLYRPEWPAASLFVRILSKALIHHLEDHKQGAESSSAKNVALDYIGDIGARLRSLQLEMESQPIVPSLDELIAKPSPEGLAKLLDSHMVVQGYLASAARDDSMYASSAEMTRTIWAQELQAALSKAASVLQNLSEASMEPTAEADMEAEETDVQDREQLAKIVQSLRKAARDVWNANRGLFEIGASKRDEDAAQASYAISRARELQKAFDYILHSLISAMGFSGVAHRSKALRGLAAIVVTDPNILSEQHVGNAIYERLHDSSTAPRDAAVDLIGKYVVQRSEWANQYFPIISSLISDKGLSVRKRVVKLLRDMCAVADEQETRVKICAKLVVATQDEEDSIKDLALKSLTEILFPTPFVPDQSADLLVDILEQTRGTDERLEQALEGMSKLCDKAGHKDRFVQTIESLIDRMPSSGDETTADAKSYIRVIYLLSHDNPGLIDAKKADVLKDHLFTRPNNNDELVSNDWLLQMFTRSVPYLPKAASTFANDLTGKIRQMVVTPVNAPSLLRPIACWAAVAHNITKNYRPMVGLLRNVMKKIPSAQDKQLGILQYITALLAEHAKLEAAVRNVPDLAAVVKDIAHGEPLSEYLFGQYLKWSAVETGSQKQPILCLASIFRGYPRLILDPKAEKWMTSVFESDNEDNKAYLLNLLGSFLQAEADRRALGASDRDVTDLIGSASELHESGISTALVQNMIDHVIESAKSHHHSRQGAAMTVLTFTVNQGLYHPLLLLPLLISLETSEDHRMSANALKLHKTLYSKHASMLNCRYLEFARTSFEYQRTITAEVVGQRDGKALLGPWWSLLKEDKRATRIKFLESILHAFQFDLASSNEIHPAFVLYVAENLAVLDYQQQEEVMLVVQYLSRVVSDGGTPVANHIETGVVEGSGIGLLEDKMTVVSETEKYPAVRLANASIVVVLALLTKNLLLDVYNLTEEKCLAFDSKKRHGLVPANRRQQDSGPITLDTSRMPLARGVESVEDYMSQRDMFMQLMKEDLSMGVMSWAM